MRDRLAGVANRPLPSCTLTSGLFHHAGEGAPRVVGCQVLAPEDMKELTAGVDGAAASFEYVLIEGAKLDAGELPITAAAQRYFPNETFAPRSGVQPV